MKTLHLTNYWHGTSGGIARFYSALLDAATGRAGDAAGGSVGRNASPRGRQIRRIYHVAAPHAPLNSRYRVLIPLSFAGWQPFTAHSGAGTPGLVEICDKYSLNYLGTVLRLGLLEGLDFKPVVVAKAASAWTTTSVLRDRRGWTGVRFVLHALALLSVFRSPHRDSSYTAEN